MYTTTYFEFAEAHFSNYQKHYENCDKVAVGHNPIFSRGLAEKMRLPRWEAAEPSQAKLSWTRQADRAQDEPALSPAEKERSHPDPSRAKICLFVERFHYCSFCIVLPRTL